MTLIHRPFPVSIHTAKFLLMQVGSEVEEWKPYLWNDNKGDTRFQYVH